MNRLTDFYKSNKHAILWTVCYLILMYLILKGLFNFNMLSVGNWHRLANARLHGFAGFVFGILILAAIPLYIATTTIILRTKEPLFTITIPEKLKKIFTPTPLESTTETPAPSITEDTSESSTASPEIPKDMPMEMRPAFLRARQHLSTIQTTEFKSPVPQPAPTESIPAPTLDELPLPADFDLDINTAIETLPTTPVFTEINFDNPIASTDAPAITELTEKSLVGEYLAAKSKPYKTENNIILTDNMAIAEHTDTDFWVADQESWFASGKQRPSPVAAVKTAATTHGLRPVLYLAATNIMDIDAKRQEWSDSGILVITDLSELPD